MSRYFLIIAVFFVGCSDSNEEFIFDKSFSSTCEAFTEISKYALEIHVSKASDQYGSLRKETAKKLANSLNYKESLPTTKDCLDIETLADSQSKFSKTKIYDSALFFFMQSMDPHSLYIPEEGALEMKKQDKGIYFGAGYEPKYVHRAIKATIPIDTILLDYVYPDSTAYGKLLPEDEIEMINGEEVTGKLATDIYQIIEKEPKKTEVKIKRDDLTFSLQRNEFKKPPLYSHPIKGFKSHFDLIRIQKFSPGVSDELKKKLEQLNTAQVDGLILDLRGNPGGQVDEGVAVLNLFLSKNGEVFHTEGSKKNAISRQFSHEVYKVDGKALFTKPLVVLVDSDTASISEAVAGVLHYKSRALILGNQTFGKGSVQINQNLSPRSGFGGMLITTVSLMYYPNNDTHQINGVTPDFSLKDKKFELAIEKVKEKKMSSVFYEKEYSNVIQPHINEIKSSDLEPVFTLNKEKISQELDNTCENVVYQRCLETYAVRFLEMLVNKDAI